MSEQKEEVVHPEHYLPGPYEVYKILNAWNMNFNRGNAIKYLVRAGKKNTVDEIKDLRKAKQYIDYEIERLNNLNE